MGDGKLAPSHSDSPLPEAGHGPLRPEIDEHNSTPNSPIADPSLDMEAADEKDQMPGQDDSEEAGLSDNESALSELDDRQFDDFDEEDIRVEERPAQMIDDTNVNLIGVHKRKRTEGDSDLPKKKKKKADRPRRKKARDEEAGGDDEGGATRKSRRAKKEARVRGASPEEDADESLTPEERMSVL